MNDKLYMTMSISVHEAQLNGMKLVANKVTDEEFEAETKRIIDQLYKRISGMEPKHESEVV